MIIKLIYFYLIKRRIDFSSLMHYSKLINLSADHAALLNIV